MAHETTSRQRSLHLIWTMTLIVLVALTVALVQLWRSTHQGQEIRLLEQITAQKQMIEAMARFDSHHAGIAHPDKKRASIV
ncbi:MAG: hypothetical protein HQL50_14265, partial [Magnetococcales bacterium]|nr:hypothetical protein [Magnetococcales bacterium]